MLEAEAQLNFLLSLVLRLHKGLDLTGELCHTLLELKPHAREYQLYYRLWGPHGGLQRNPRGRGLLNQGRFNSVPAWNATL